MQRPSNVAKDPSRLEPVAAAAQLSYSASAP